MLGVGGKERTEAQYHNLLGEAGLRIARIIVHRRQFLGDRSPRA